MPQRFLALKWLIPAACFVGCFGLIAWDVAAEGALYRIDHSWAETLFNWGCSRADLHSIITFVTNLGAGKVLTLVGCVNTLVFICRRDWQAACVFGLSQWLLFDWIPLAKSIFERQRPPFLGWTDLSFPSGHATGSATVYGVSIVVSWIVLRPYRIRWPIAIAFFSLILVIAASRPLYGAHYISDVLAGMCLGFAYVCLMVTFGNPKGMRKVTASKF